MLPDCPERKEQGQAARRLVKRSEHAAWDGSRRTHDPVDVVLASTYGRLPQLVPIKMARMAVSPFGFYRGNVPLMAADLSILPDTKIHAQLCGDAHVRNLGAFEAPDGRLIFDINDFDETIRGPFEWDIKRLATSLILAGREAGAKDGRCSDAAHAFLASYRTRMHIFAHMPVLELA